jgi:hypothetical protein
VITADIYRKFLEKNTGFGKTPINARDERDFLRILKTQFNQALAPYKTPLNTYSFDEEIARIFLKKSHCTRTKEIARIFLNTTNIKHMLQNLAWQEDLRKNVESEILDRLTVLDRPLKEFVGVFVQRASSELKTKLDAYNQERERDHRQGAEQKGFLSILWEETEMD